MFVYKIFEVTNNFFHYVISHIDDEEMVLEHQEHYAVHHADKLINKYFNLIAWDNVDIEKVDIKPSDVINKSLPSNEKCMNISNKFEEFIVEPPPKAKRTAKPKAEPKSAKTPKPKGKVSKASVNIDHDQKTVVF